MVKQLFPLTTSLPDAGCASGIDNGVEPRQTWIRRGMVGPRENSSGQKIKIFLANNFRRGVGMTFFSPWRGIGTFWFILARNLHILARICTLC